MKKAERIVRVVAGFVVMVSLALGVQASPLFVSQYFLFLVAFVGFNLFQSGCTKFCPMMNVLSKAGVKMEG